MSDPTSAERPAPAYREWCTTRAQPDKGTTRSDVRLSRLAAQQTGIVSSRQLNPCGLDADAIAVRVKRGQLHPVFRGVYAVGHDGLSRRALFTAAVLACGPGAVLSHYAAAAHLGVVEWEDRLPEVIVRRNGGRRINGIRVHRCRLNARDVWCRDGIQVTSPARTILDLAATMGPQALRRTVRQAQAEQLVNVRQLLDMLACHRGHRGAAKLRAVIAGGPAPTRSAHEDLILDLIDEAGIERPEINPKLDLDGRRIVPDMLWRAQLLVVECDSRRWHSDPLTRANDAEKQAFLEVRGYRVLRVTWEQGVNQPMATISRISGAVDRSSQATAVRSIVR